MSFQKVDVAAIAEFPTTLGIKCSLLNHYGLSPYIDSEELIFDVLTSTAKEEFFELCLQNGCRAFYEEYRKGRTPFIDKDPIRLVEHGGQYWVMEGKHRVCLAKRMGVKQIEAHVAHIPESLALLSPVGQPQTFTARYIVREARSGFVKVEGSILCLWLFPPSPRDLPRPEMGSMYSFGQILWLNRYAACEGNLVDYVPGISYKIDIKKRKVGRFRARQEVTEVEGVVDIGEHPKMKIWLFKFDVNGLFKIFQPLESATLYRRGLWREHHRKGCRMLEGGYSVAYL